MGSDIRALPSLLLECLETLPPLLLLQKGFEIFTTRRQLRAGHGRHGHGPRHGHGVGGCTAPHHTTAQQWVRRELHSAIRLDRIQYIHLFRIGAQARLPFVHAPLVRLCIFVCSLCVSCYSTMYVSFFCFLHFSHLCVCVVNRT